MSIRSEPHFELPSTELAAWIDKQGASVWWSLDGEPVITGRIIMPCTGDKLAEQFRRLNRPLLVYDHRHRPEADGRTIGAADLDSLMDVRSSFTPYVGEKPVWADDRILYCCWKDSDIEWLLMEDTRARLDEERDALELQEKG